MKINDKNVLEELSKILSTIKSAYDYSNSSSCDRLLCKVIGKLDTLISVLSVAKDD